MVRIKSIFPLNGANIIQIRWPFLKLHIKYANKHMEVYKTLSSNLPLQENIFTLPKIDIRTHYLKSNLHVKLPHSNMPYSIHSPHSMYFIFSMHFALNFYIVWWKMPIPTNPGRDYPSVKVTFGIQQYLNAPGELISKWELLDISRSIFKARVHCTDAGYCKVFLSAPRRWVCV